MIHHVSRASRHLIFWTLLLAAIGLSAVRLMLIGIEHYKTDLETRMSIVAGVPVKLGKLGANMRGITPELMLKNVDITRAITTEKPAVHIKEIRLSLDLGSFVLKGELLPSSSITLVGADLAVYRNSDGQFGIDGIKPKPGNPLWLLQGQYTLLHSQIRWQDRLQQSQPIVFEDINLAVRNSGVSHRLNLVASLPASKGGDVRVIADFTEESGEISALQGTVYIESQHLKLSELITSYLPNDIKIPAGQANVKLWSQWHNAQPVSAQGSLQLQHALLIRENYGRLPIKQLDAAFKLDVKPTGWKLAFSQFALETLAFANHPATRWRNAILTLANNPADAGMPHKIKLFAKQLDLSEATQLIKFIGILPKNHIENITNANPKGWLENFTVYAEPDTQNFAMAGRFKGLSFSPVQKLPGLVNLDGRLKGTNQTGLLQLSANNSQLKADSMFIKPLIFDKINGLLSWQQTQVNWQFSTADLNLDSPAFSSKSRLNIILPKTDDHCFVDLQSAFNSSDISRIVNYLPSRLLKDRLNYWLTMGLKRGKISGGNLLFHGKPNSFPFKDNSGVFQAQLNLDDTDLKYHQDWPEITGIKGQVNFNNDVINGKFTEGKTGSLIIGKTEVTLNNLTQDAQLILKGQSEDQVVDMLSVLQYSPLAAEVNPILAATNISGAAKTTLDLLVPLKLGEPPKVKATALLTNAQLTGKLINIPLSKINGTVIFTQEAIIGKDINAVAFNKPVNINVTTLNDQQTQINIAGRINIHDLEKQLQQPLYSWANGESSYQFKLNLPNNPLANTPMVATLNSDLIGIELTLPGGVSKLRTQKKPLSATITLGNQDKIPLKINYNNELKTAFNFASHNQKIVSGHILFGSGVATPPIQPGIKLEINKPQLTLQDWFASAGQTGNTPSNEISTIKIHTGSALWNKTRLGAFSLDLNRNGDYWHGTIDSIAAQGQVQIPLDLTQAKPVLLDMDMLNLSALKQFHSQTAPTGQNIKSLLNIRSKKTLWQSANLGQLTLETQRNAQGAHIKRLSIEGQDETLELDGDWTHNKFSAATAIKGRLSMKRADLFFSKLNITKDFDDTSGTIDFKLNWNALPWQLTLNNLSGQMAVNLNSGQILSIEPGFGRVLGILAIEQWIKRLQLDFSDVFDEGLTFNSIKGDFNLHNGIAVTKNLFIDAVPAKITITGDTNLINQTVDHVIKVVPKSSDAVPIAGTIMGKIAEFIGKSVTGKNQEGFFFGREYLVKGKWDNTIIKPLHENDGIFQKTWNSITAFPWVK
jgi:uncharacterized protein (TIGR02099 family)